MYFSIVPRNDKSIAKTIFLAWLMREICSFRDAEYWGQYTQKESQVMRKLRQKPTQSTPQPHPVAMFFTNFIVNFLFFGIPHTYQAHVKASVLLSSISRVLTPICYSANERTPWATLRHQSKLEKLCWPSCTRVFAFLAHCEFHLPWREIFLTLILQCL